MANNIKIKICGQNNPAIINHCLDLNISYQGLIFYEKSPRFIDKEDGGFSFSWKKGEYEAFNVSAVKPKTIYKVDDVELACTAIPNDIKYAQYELARALANDTDAITGTTGKDGNFEEVRLGDIQVKYNTDSQGTGAINNIMDVYPWLQSYLGAYMLGGAGAFQMRVVRG